MYDCRHKHAAYRPNRSLGKIRVERDESLANYETTHWNVGGHHGDQGVSQLNKSARVGITDGKLTPPQPRASALNLAGHWSVEMPVSQNKSWCSPDGPFTKY